MAVSQERGYRDAGMCCNLVTSSSCQGGRGHSSQWRSKAKGKPAVRELELQVEDGFGSCVDEDEGTLGRQVQGWSMQALL